MVGAIPIVDAVLVIYGAEMAECHRKPPVAVRMLLLRRYLDVIWAVLEAKGGVVLRTSAGRWREAVGDP